MLPGFSTRLALGVVLFSGVSLADINLSPSSVNISAAGGTGSVQVINTNSSSWTAASDQPWLRITSGASGNGNGTISYVVDGNPLAKKREGTITVRRGGAETDILPVTQNGGVISVSPSDANVQGSGGNGTLTITAHESPFLQWTATSDQSWLTVTSISPTNPTQGNGSVSWTAQPNSGAPRTGRITVLPRDGTGIVFVVNQAQGAGSISVSPSSLDLDAAGANGSIQVTASVQSITWNATSSQSWLTLTSGSGPGTKSFQYSATANPSAVGRAATITIVASAGPTQTVSVTQSGATLTVTPATANSAAGGGSGSVAVGTSSSALKWTAVIDQPWLTLSPPLPASPAGSMTLNWSAGANLTTTARTAKIRFTPDGGTEVAIKTFTVSQQGIGTDDFKVNPPTSTAPATASTGLLNVVSTVSSLTWAAASNQSWLHITSGSSGTGNGQIQYSVDVTNVAATRTAIITVTPAAGAPVTSTITQTGGVLTVQPLSANPSPSGGTGSITITTSIGTLTWNSSSTAPWLTITSVQNGSGSVNLNWAAQSNLSGSSRTAKIQVTPNGGSPVEFSVTQEALTGTLVSSAQSRTFSYQLGSPPPADAQILITSTPTGLPFTASASTVSGGNWLTVTGTGPAPAALSISVNPAGLAAGIYSGTVAIVSAIATNSPINISISLEIVPVPVLQAQPSEISFSYQQNGPAAAAQVVTLSTSRGQLDYTILPDLDAPWLSAVGAGPAPANLTIAVSPQNLGPGTYRGRIRLQAPAAGNSPFSVPVSFTITAAPNLVPSPSSLSFNIREGDAAPAPVSLGMGSSGGSAVPLPFTAATTASWLTATGGTTTPTTLLVSANPTGLAIGTHQASIVVSSNVAGNSPQLVPVTLTILPGYRITANPALISFNLTQGGGVLRRQGPIGRATTALTISSNAQVPFEATTQTASGGNWLDVQNLAPSLFGLNLPNTPAVLAVIATVGDLLPGTYEGSIILTSTSVINSPVVIPVVLNVSVQPQLTVAPGQLSFAYQRLSGPSTLPAQGLVISTPDPAVVTASAASSGGNWLSVTSGGTTPAVIQATVNAENLAPGSYLGTITLTSPGYASSIVEVPLTVTDAPVLRIQPDVLEFSYQQGGTLPPSQTFSVASSSNAIAFAVSNNVTPWLSVNGGGTTPGNVSVAVIPGSMGPGTYDTALLVSSSQAGNSPVAVRVRLNITAGPLILAQPTSLSFDYTQRQSVPPVQSLSISSSQALSFSTSISGAQSWLSVTGGTQTDASLNVSVNPADLEPGSYTTAILINAPGADNNPVSIPVTLTVHAAPRLETSLDSIVFPYQIGGATPSNHVIVVTSSLSSLIATGTAVNGSGESWLSISGGSQVPAAFSISANPAGLQPGIHNASIVFTAPGAENSPVSVPVTLLVSAAPVIQTSPAQLSLSYQIGLPVPTIAPIQVTSSGNPISFQVTASTETGGSWLSASNGSTTPALVSINLDPSGLVPGTYTGSITFQSPSAGNTLTVPVTLTVGTSLSLSAGPNSLTFAAQQNGLQPAPQTIQIQTGTNAIPVSYSKSPGAAWLTLSGTGTTPADLAVTISAAGLAPGKYSAVILVQSALAANSPLEIPVSLEVTAEPVLQTDPAVLHFSYTVGGAMPTFQTFHVASSGASLNYEASVFPGAPWLSASAFGQTPGEVVVSVNPGALPPDTYQGTIQLMSPSTSQITQVSVNLTVSAAATLTSAPNLLTFAYQAGGQIPSAQTLIVRSDPYPVAVTTGLTTFGDGSFITITGGGTTPAPFSISVDPTGLTPGVYRQEIVISSPDVTTGPIRVPITLRVTNAPALVSQVSELAFTAEFGSTSPANRPIAISASDGTALPISAQVSSGIEWLTITNNANATPATITVAANPAGLSAGVYFGSIIISSTAPGIGPKVIPVALTITSQPVLVVAPSGLSFSAVPLASPPTPVAINVSSGGVPLTVTAAPGPGNPWLSVSGGGTTPNLITIGVNHAGLAPGSYHGTVFVTASGVGNSPFGVPVDLVVSATPLLTASPSFLSFDSAALTHLTTNVSTTIPGTLISAVSSGNTPWLLVNGGGPSPQSVGVDVDATGLTPGTYQGALQLTAPGVANSPLLVPVVLTVIAAPSARAIPTALQFQYDSGGPLPASQPVNLALGDVPANQSQVSVAPGTPWLSVSPFSGGTFSVSVDPRGLLAGDYTGSIQITTPDAANNPLTIPVHFKVTGVPTLSLSKDAIVFAGLVSQAQPLSTVLSIGGSTTPINLSFDVTGSTWLSVTPLSGATPLDLTVTANPAGLQAGNYFGSIRISSNGMSLRTVPVNLTVAPDPALGVSPQLLTFKYTHGGNPPDPANLYLAITQPLTIQATASDSWISIALGTTASAPARVTVNPTGLAAGTYHGSITLSAADSGSGAVLTTRNVPVELYVDQPAVPRLISAVNGMSFLPTPLAPGLIFSIFGTGLGPSTPEKSQPVSNVLPSTLGGVQVLVNGILCPVMYVSETQINAIAPYALYTKTAATVAVQRNGILSDELPVQVAASSPGLFSAAETGTGPGVILNQDQRSNSPQNPAARGSIISLFGGGDGQNAPQGIDGVVASNPLSTPLLPVSVFIGGIPALDISYAGAGPAQVAIFQVNVKIPENAPSGNVTVLVRIGDTTQQLLTVSIEGVRRSRQ